MENLATLEASERALLLQYPAYISLLAINSKGGAGTEEDRKAAIRFSHIKTFSCHPRLAGFYREADRLFEAHIRQLDEMLPAEKTARETEIKKALGKLDQILLKLGRDYAALLHQSMASFKTHVSQAHHNILEDFIFPLPIKGITE